MKRILTATALAMILATPAFAQTTTPTTPGTAPNAPSAAAPNNAGALTNIPASNMALSDWYRQAVYDNANNKIGDISDVLIDQQKKASVAILGVGGFLGIGEKNVAVPFDSIKRTVRDGKVYLTMDANKDQLKAAQGLRYDRVTNSWGADTASNTNNRTGTGTGMGGPTNNNSSDTMPRK